eukprot:scaffold56624_cov13-Tisochrysis_lutea.AAC.2
MAVMMESVIIAVKSGCHCAQTISYALSRDYVHLGGHEWSGVLPSLSPPVAPSAADPAPQQPHLQCPS